MSLANRTASVADSGLTTSHAYDGDGVRLAVSSWASAIDYLPDAADRVAGGLAWSYAYEPFGATRLVVAGTEGGTGYEGQSLRP